jgi:DNA-binding MarR family transcriptional regulator
MSISKTTKHFAFFSELASDPLTRDLDPAHIRCILYLASLKGRRATVGTLTVGSHMKRRSETSTRITKLVALGILDSNRDPEDGRQVWLTLTDKGQRVAAQVAELYRAPLAERHKVEAAG